MPKKEKLLQHKREKGEEGGAFLEGSIVLQFGGKKILHEDF